jgi:capsular exopolysaccharide synthesis family protein
MAKRSRKDNLQRLVNDAAAALLANIRFMSVDDPIRTIEITSSIPNEGKSFVSINLAQTIAGSGKTCLLMEGDLRKRSLATAMGIHPKNGLYAVLSDTLPFNKVAVQTPQENLYFLDAEPQIPNPPDLFSSKRFARFVEQMKKTFDYVVIDTAPVGTFVDAAVISTYMDATFMVVRENFTKRNLILSAYDQLVQAGANVAGVIMNDCGRSESSYYDYYSYYDSYGKRRGEKSGATASAFHPKRSSSKNADKSFGRHVHSAKPAEVSGKNADRAGKNVKNASTTSQVGEDASKYSRANYAKRHSKK